MNFFFVLVYFLSAAADGQFVIVKWLVSAGADCNARNASGATPLHRCAVAASNVGDMALLLIGGGADPFVRNGSGLLAADLTTSIAIRALLLDAGSLPAVRFRVPRELISHIVGKGGERLQTLQQRTVTVIKLPPRDSQLDEILVRGLADGIHTVKEFLINGIVTEGKSLINVHDVRMSTLPHARSSSPLMLITDDMPPTTVKRSSSAGHKPVVPPATALNGSSIRSDSEPRSSRRVLAMASTVVKAQSPRRATDVGTSNSTSTNTSAAPAPVPVQQRRDVHDDNSVADDNAAKSSSSTVSKKKKKKKKKSKSSSSKVAKDSENAATESSSQPAESALTSALVTAPRTRSRGSDRSQTSLSCSSDRDMSLSRSGSDRSDRSDRSRAVSRSSSSSRIETR